MEAGCAVETALTGEQNTTHEEDRGASLWACVCHDLSHGLRADRAGREPGPGADVLRAVPGRRYTRGFGDGSRYSHIPTPASPITSKITITTVADGTLIYYDQWENGYDP